VDISIIICSCNRPDSLRRTLAAITRLSVPDGMSAELIAVDNASTDETAAVIRECPAGPFVVRYISEPVPGKSRALNRAFAEAKGEIIVCTDDDIIPAPDWLARICAPILDGTADAVAGCIQPGPGLARPWMGAAHRAWLPGCTETLDPLKPGRLVGANMAFSRSVFEKVPAFDVELGPGALGFGEETLFSEQLKIAGYRIATAFDAIVEHHFSEDRLSERALFDKARRLGWSDAYLAHHWQHETWPSSLWQVFTAALGRARHQILWTLTGSKQETMPLSLLTATRHLHACIRYLKERKRPRNYERCGLVKLSQNRTGNPPPPAGNCGSAFDRSCGATPR
jgi:glycosyltransferase involved in cell wall biosynthesis